MLTASLPGYLLQQQWCPQRQLERNMSMHAACSSNSPAWSEEGGNSQETGILSNPNRIQMHQSLRLTHKQSNPVTEHAPMTQRKKRCISQGQSERSMLGNIATMDVRDGGCTI